MPAPKTHARVPSLRYWRIKKHWTQRELAEHAEVSVTTVARGEQAYPIALLSAGKLADALGVSVRRLQEQEPQS
jgi:transcriptional regulator with XRE-family HTH domain